MQQQLSKRRRGSTRLKDRNVELSPSVRSTILGLHEAIDGECDFQLSYLRESYLSKYCDETLVPAATRRHNAIEKWKATEGRNATINQWWRDADPGFNILPRVSLKSFLRRCRTLIRDILGPLSDELVLGSFSGGASTSRGRTQSLPALKFTEKADVTESAEKFVDLVFHVAPLLRQHVSSFHDLKIVEGNVLFTVPKKTDIDRCACKEPDINMFLQKGVGLHIRKRLLRFGINLNDQSVNQRLACQGSRDSTLMTIDLSAASDSMTVEVVRALLPKLWFEYLDDIRSHVSMVDGETVRLEMFSSMGNGFTFELESLLFFAIMRTVQYFTATPGVLSVYGDDIIAPSELYDDSQFVLGRFGFLLNADKSFAKGLFRESCGGHYYAGLDVTPFYLKSEPKRLTDLIRVANQFRQWSLTATTIRQYEFTNLYHLWRQLADCVPTDLWGGCDYNVDTQLVSPPKGRYKLQRLSSPRRVPDVGKYLHWHNLNWNRTALGNPQADPVSTNQICRYRRTTPGAPLPEHYFHEEVAIESVPSA